MLVLGFAFLLLVQSKASQRGKREFDVDQQYQDQIERLKLRYHDQFYGKRDNAKPPRGDQRPPAGDQRPPLRDQRPPAGDQQRAPPSFGDQQRLAERDFSENLPRPTVRDARPTFRDVRHKKRGFGGTQPPTTKNPLFEGKFLLRDQQRPPKSGDQQPREQDFRQELPRPTRRDPQYEERDFRQELPRPTRRDPRYEEEDFRLPRPTRRDPQFKLIQTRREPLYEGFHRAPPSGKKDQQYPPSRGDQQRPPKGDQQRPPNGDQRLPPPGDQQLPPHGDQRRPPPSGDQRRPPNGDQRLPPPGDQQLPPHGDQRLPPPGDQQRPPNGDQRRPPNGDQVPPMGGDTPTGRDSWSRPNGDEKIQAPPALPLDEKIELPTEYYRPGDERIKQSNKHRGDEAKLEMEDVMKNTFEKVKLQLYARMVKSDANDEFVPIRAQVYMKNTKG